MGRRIHLDEWVVETREPFHTVNYLSDQSKAKSWPRKFGKYELLELLGKGGMAEVFLARSFGAEGLEKRLVIKRILPEYAQKPQFISMFIDEAKIAVTLNHPNIVQT